MAKEREEGIRELEAIREKLEAFVRWVLTYRKWILLGLAILVAAGIGTYAYQKAKLRGEERASLLLLKALNSQDADQRLTLLDAVVKERWGGASSILAHYFRARERMEQGEWEGARKDLEVVIKKGPQVLRAQALCLLGDVLASQGDKEGAVRYYEKCQAEGRGWIEAYALLKEAMALDALGKEKEALMAYQKVLPLLPQGEVELFVRLRLKDLGA